MDEDELLYREMNEEDPWYMGDASEDDGEDECYGEEEETFVRPTSEENQERPYWNNSDVAIGFISIAIIAIVVFVWLLS